MVKENKNDMKVNHRYDVSQQHRATVEENSRRMKQIEEANPDKFPFDKEWCRLREENRMAQMNIDHYDKTIKQGVKY